MIVEVPLPGGFTCLVDEESLPLIRNYTWWAIPQNRERTKWRVYGRLRGTTKATPKVYMHRIITGCVEKHWVVDHRNGNPLDNTLANLRVCTRSENLRNRGKNKNNKTGFKGVHFSTKRGCYVAQCYDREGRNVGLGLFRTAEEASRAYKLFAAGEHEDFFNAG